MPDSNAGSARSKAPRILLWDLETSPNLVTTWSLRIDGYLDPDNIVQERTILCAGWKWLHEKSVHSISIKPSSPGNDRAIVAKMAKLIDSADAIVTHNGIQFDMPWLRTRAIKHGIALPPSTPHLDTKVMAARHCYFNSNKLNYLGKFLELGEKIPTQFSLWKKVMAGQPRAIADMAKYCRQDVRLLEAVYLKLRPYVEAKLNHSLWIAGGCPTCGTGKLVGHGMRATRTQLQQRLRCISCGASCYRPMKSKIAR